MPYVNRYLDFCSVEGYEGFFVPLEVSFINCVT